MEESHRVCFDFAGEKQVHYLTELPSVGDFVTHIGALWVVEKVNEDDAGVVVVCKAPSDPVRLAPRPSERPKVRHSSFLQRNA